MYKNEHARKKHEDRFLARQGRLSPVYSTKFSLIFIEDSRMYPCEKCGSKFQSEERLKYHVKELIGTLCRYFSSKYREEIFNLEIARA